MKLVWMAALTIGIVSAQTEVDLRTQAKNVNFSAANFVIPFPTGGALPALCTTGSMFFNTAAGAGSNLYGCVATNTWVAESGGTGGGGGGGATLSGVLAVQQTSGTVLTIGGNCSPATPCLVQAGSVVYTFTGTQTVTLGAGIGLVYIYVDSNGTVTAGASASGTPSLSCSGCVVAVGITQFPPGTIPLAIWSAASGTWVSGSNEAALQSGGPTFTAGTNITLTQTGNNVTIAATLGSIPSGAQPVCSAGTGGFLWYTPGATGVKDAVQVCAKDATNAYAWRTLF